jgi:purine-nucleoside phosphorylase
MASGSESKELNVFETAQLAAKIFREQSGIDSHDIALTLGSGWGGAAELLGVENFSIAATELPGFHAPALAGHVPSIRSFKLENGKNALVLGARAHLYQGHGVGAVAHGVRFAAALGVQTIVLTNGAGGIKETWKPGTPVLISDHINLTATTPLEGATFIDMSEVYSRELREVARAVDPSLDEGVYVQFRGPQYETPAEVQMAKTIGGQIVGMSTALEAIAAREAGMKLLGLSLITNLAAGISKSPLSHEEVIQAGKDAEPRIGALLAQIVNRI